MLIPVTVLPLRQVGFSMVEMMIAMAIGLGVLSGLTSYTANVIGINAKSMAQMRLQEELQVISLFLSQELKRAGARADIEGNAVKGDNPTLAKTKSYTLSQYHEESTNSCLLFSYDRDLDGVINTQKNTEFYGFRLRDSAIEYRIGGADCGQNGWQDLSDSNVIIITKLQFTSISQSGALIQIDLAAHLKQQRDRILELTKIVRVMNYG